MVTQVSKEGHGSMMGMVTQIPKKGHSYQGYMLAQHPRMICSSMVCNEAIFVLVRGIDSLYVLGSYLLGSYIQLLARFMFKVFMTR